MKRSSEGRQADISDIARLSIADARQWFVDLGDKLTGQDSEIAARILKEINERLGFLVNVGLGYLAMSRNSGTLSGGESQRIRLASQIGSGLTGVLYVLDEPSIGLHQRDNERLLSTLIRLRDLGNTVLVVEHDEEAICWRIMWWTWARCRSSWWSCCRRGHTKRCDEQPGSLTGKYLSGELKLVS